MRVRSLHLLLVVLAIAGAACTEVLDEPTLERTIAQQVGERLDEDGITVDCPADVAVEEGGVFECTATGADGAVATLEVTQLDAEGRVEWRIVDADTGGAS